MLSQTNNRTQGRFIKKSDPIRKIMNVSDFNLLEICERTPTFHDNPNANVIHNKLHSEEELSEGVRRSYEIDVAFPHEYRPVIRPLDFTEEWKKQRKRQANRQQRFEDDEDYELDLANVEKRKKHSLKNAKFTEIESVPAIAEPEKHFQQFDSPNLEHTDNGTELASLSTENSQTRASANPPLKSESINPEVDESEGFVPYYASRNLATVESPMAVTSLEPARLSDEELEKIKSEAKAEGYRQGFEIGEEKGTLSIQSKVDAINSEIANVINELQGLQKSVLNKAQENFLLVCQSMVESLLQREFKINPESFGNVIEKAITDTLPDENFTIFVNADTFAALSNWSNNELKKLLKVDPKIEDDSFRVEGQHAVVDGNLKKVISSLLEQADIELFEEQKGVG